MDLETLICPQCHAQNPKTARFCNKCGSEVSAAECPVCQNANEPEASYCNSCGSALSESGKLQSEKSGENVYNSKALTCANCYRSVQPTKRYPWWGYTPLVLFALIRYLTSTARECPACGRDMYSGELIKNDAFSVRGQDQLTREDRRRTWVATGVVGLPYAILLFAIPDARFLALLAIVGLGFWLGRKSDSSGIAGSITSGMTLGIISQIIVLIRVYDFPMRDLASYVEWLLYSMPSLMLFFFLPSLVGAWIGNKSRPASD